MGFSFKKAEAIFSGHWFDVMTILKGISKLVLKLLLLEVKQHATNCILVIFINDSFS
jgi:hypothetical protein